MLSCLVNQLAGGALAGVRPPGIAPLAITAEEDMKNRHSMSLALLLATSCGWAQGDGFTIIGAIAPLGDGIEFVLTSHAGCRTQHREKPLLHGAVLGSGRNDIPYVAGCWERLPNNDVRVYIDQWRPEYHVTTIPASAITDQVLDSTKPPPDGRASKERYAAPMATF